MVLGPKPASIAAVDRPTFTFIDHDDDLTSKRIKDTNARKAIRSHVMRDVRRRERLAGRKRVSRRENRIQQSEPAVISTYLKDDADSSDGKLVLETTTLYSVSSSSQAAESDGDVDNGKQHRRRPLIFLAGHSPSSSLSPSPRLFPISWLLDPFNTLPGASEAPSMIGRLIFHCKLPRACFVSSAFSKFTSHHSKWLWTTNPAVMVGACVLSRQSCSAILMLCPLLP